MTQWSPPRVRPSLDPSANDPYLSALRERVLIYDGATGTNFQLQDLHADDFGGAALEGCNEILVVTKPDAVESLHRSFLDVGADVIETDSFGAFSVVLNEYGIADRSFELALVSAQIARRVADEYASPGSPRFVAGSMGPGTKFPSLGQITYDDLSASYEEMALRTPRRRRRPAARRDDLRPALGQGRDRGLSSRDGATRTRRADPGPGHDRADRTDAARHRDRRGDHRAQSARHRRARPQLRDGTGRDVRAAAQSPRVLAPAALVPAQRRTAERRRRQDALRPHARRRSPNTCRSS